MVVGSLEVDGSALLKIHTFPLTLVTYLSIVLKTYAVRLNRNYVIGFYKSILC